MGVDVVIEVNGLKNAYGRARGSSMSTGRFMVPGKQVPNTTWEDTLLAAAHIMRYLDPIPSHQQTKGYKAAKAKFYAAAPLGKYGLMHPLQYIGKNQIYPNNEEFWGAAQDYAIERSAAGVVPKWSDLAIESIKESIQELPDTISNAFDYVNPMNLVPKLTPLAEIIKWGSIGGGLFILYKYVLKPKK